MNGLPNPLVSAHVDISKLDGFMLDTKRLLSSELMALATPDEGWAAVKLWCRAWQQRPAASLPDDDRVLASFAGVDLRKWPKVKEMAMRGFTKCSDGRLYHPVLAADANRAWEALEKRRERTQAATQARRSRPDDERDDRRNGPRNDGLNDNRNGQRDGYRNDARNEVPIIARAPTGRDEAIPGENTASAIGGGSRARPNGDGNQQLSDQLSGWFGARRRHHWPNDSSFAAPTLTLATEAKQWLDAGGTAELIREVVERGMAGKAEQGLSSPNSFKDFRKSLNDAIVRHRNGAGVEVHKPGVSTEPVPTAAEVAQHKAAIERAARNAS